jgi:D-serine deaminase-like pyridoxal phosphate-dependent protein
MAAGGVRDIFLAYPLWAAGVKARRLRDLHVRDDLTLSVGVDSVEGGRALAAAVGGMTKPLQVVVELDPGYHRTGVHPSTAGSLAEQLRALGLDVVGVFTHGGHAYKGRDMVGQASADEVSAIEVGRDALRAAGFEPTVLSAGSTPTALGAARAPVNEVRPGTYIVNDRIQVHMGSSAPSDVAIAVATTVVSRPASDRFGAQSR